MDKKKRLLLNDINIQIFFGRLMVNVLNINYEPPVPMRYFNTHKHNSYEFHFIPQGKGILRIGNMRYDILPGCFYLTGPDVYHEQISDNDEPMEEYSINLELKYLDSWNKKDSSNPVQEILGINGILLNSSFWLGKDTYSSWQLIQKVIEEYQEPMLGYYRNIESLITQLIINIVRCFDRHKKVLYKKTSETLHQNRKKIIDSFFREYFKPLKPEILANLLGVSVRQMERIILQYYGMTFNEVIIKTRLQIAKDLLQNTTLSLEEITFKIGFSSPSHFSKVFKEHEGISPSEYKKGIIP
jgi:Transcriptional regulator containing an amidase domain and an AraC-type DNA-binding HTH domain